MPLSNDARGWVMTGLSGVACIFGASFICIDIIVRQFPGQRGFRIQDSDVFLSVSLSLSFGVMLFSALYKMLPSSKRSLQDAGFSPQEASWILIACFIGGVVGIQFLSKLMHSFMTHDIIDCEHNHQDEEVDGKHAHHDGHVHDDDHRHGYSEVHVIGHQTSSRESRSVTGRVSRESSTPRSTSYLRSSRSFTRPAVTEAEGESALKDGSSEARPTLQQRITASIAGKDPSCTLDEPCYGFSEVCGPDCFKKVTLRGGSRARSQYEKQLSRPHFTATESTPLLQTTLREDKNRPQTSASAPRATKVHREHLDCDVGPSDDSSATIDTHASPSHSLHKTQSHETDSLERERHHHHVPTNAFLSIGLQTSIAIALHKLPEGFITYATNHANPRLGFSVFLALFIHNITEGFALALPLYLAINNRFKAMVISFALGGLSQPLGAGVAALWFKLAGTSNWAPSEGVYGGMFAVTAGIMASVALQLFSESLDLTHSKNLCMIGAFAGMAILGMSSALTA